MSVYVVSICDSCQKKIPLYRIQVLFKYNSSPPDVEEIEWIKRRLEELIDQMIEDMTDEKQLDFTLTILNFKNHEVGNVAFRPVAETSDLSDMYC